MAARVESQAGGTDDGVAPSIPSAFKNKLMLGVTEAIMWIACRRHFSRETIREHLERRTLNLRRPNREPQMSPALQGRVDKAEFQLFRMIIGGVPAIGTLDHEGRPNHHERIRVPVDFLKDGAYIELLSGHIRADPLLEKHSGYQRPTYLDVDIERDAFFKALAAAEPRSQATDDKPIELADTSLAKGQEDVPAQTLPPHDAQPSTPAKADQAQTDDEQIAKEPQSHKLTSEDRKRGGSRKRYNPGFQTFINQRSTEFTRSGKPFSLSAVKDWLHENVRDEEPYQSGINDCDEIEFVENTLFWKDKNGRPHSLRVRSFERYIQRAKQR